MSSTVLEDVARIIDPEPWAQVDRWYVHGERVNVDRSIVKPSVDKARTILALIPGRDEAALPEAPEGWVLVPREPKVEMVAAFWRVKNGHHFDGEPPPADTSDYAAYRAMLASAPPPPPVGGQAWKPTHRHVKTGGLYRLVSSAILQTSEPVADEAFLALYQGADGLFWVRPADEFKDGRFAALSADPVPVDREGGL